MKRINLTIEDEVYLEILKQGIIEKQELSKTVNEFLKKYLHKDIEYEKEINNLNKELLKIRERKLMHLINEIKKIKDQEKESEERTRLNKAKYKAIRNSGILEDL